MNTFGKTFFAGALAVLSAGLGSGLTAVSAAAQEAKQTIMPEDAEALAFQEAVGYSDAVISGGMIYLSGVVAVPVEGEETMAPAFTRAFEALGKTLERAGASWDDVVVFDTFHTDLAGQLNEFVEVKNRYVKAPFPAWTAIGVTSLYEPEALVEIKITARVPE
jgi:enamine deaminase RidA (YjgF/YER057c/UK114 family)